MAGDVEAEGLLFALQGVAQIPRVAGRVFVEFLRRVSRAGPVLEQGKQRRLSALAIATGAARTLEREIDGGEGARTVDAARSQGGVESAALNERLERRLVDAARVDAAGEVEQIVKRPPRGARFEHGLQRAVANAAHGAEPEADLRSVAV